MAQNNTTRWTAPTFSFNTEDQPAAWKEFYTRVIDYLETIDIDPEQEDQHKRGWKQIKMMFTGEDRQALQTMIDNNTITPADQCTPIQALKAIQTAIKDEEHYWHYRDEILSNIRQQPEEQVHALSNRIIALVNNCSFQDQQTTETIKIMLLQHAIRYHEARNWIRQQDPAALTYKSLLQHCKSLGQRCKHYRKAQQKGRAELTSLATASVTSNAIHQDAITTHPNHNNCYRCGYHHQPNDCPARGQRCYYCNNIGHFSHLCKSQNTLTATDTTQEDQATEDTVEDLQADLPVDQATEADHTTDAQGDTEAPHHIPLTFLPSQDPMQHQQTTQETIQHNWKNAKADNQHLFHQNPSHFPPSVIWKTHQTQHQKSA